MSEIEQPCWNGKITRMRQEGDVRVFEDIQLFSIGVVSDPLPELDLTVKKSMALLPEGMIFPRGNPVDILKPVYPPPIVDDAGIDIYNCVPERVKQEIRDNIWKYLEQVQRDYPSSPRAEAT